MAAMHMFSTVSTMCMDVHDDACKHDTSCGDTSRYSCIDVWNDHEKSASDTTHPPTTCHISACEYYDCDEHANVVTDKINKKQQCAVDIVAYGCELSIVFAPGTICSRFDAFQFKR